jgi:hypothetical protein
MKTTLKFQQGDIVIKTAIIAKKQWGKKLNHTILQKSDVSGHAHVVRGNAVLFSTEKADEFFLEVLDNNTKVVHEEHKEIKIPKGKYFVYGVREFDPFEEEIRRVRD